MGPICMLDGASASPAGAAGGCIPLVGITPYEQRIEETPQNAAGFEVNRSVPSAIGTMPRQAAG